MKRASILILILAAIGAIFANAQSSPAGLASSIAPTGTLRAAFLGDNPVLGRVDPSTKAVTGPVADFVKELARRLGVPYELIPASGMRDIMSRLQMRTADLGFMAYNAGRAMEVDFTQAWLLMPNTYIVRGDSPIQSSADADRAGVHIRVVKNDTQDVYLSAHLKNTKLDEIPAMPSLEDLNQMLAGGAIDAFAANKQRLIEAAEKFPNLRVIPDSYFTAGQAVCIAKGDPARLDALEKLIDEVLRGDVVKNSIAHAGLRGVEAAPPR